MPTVPNMPLNFDALRKALVEEIQRVTAVTCIVAEPETQNVPRPPKPYFTLKMVSPAIKQGDDSASNLGGTVWNRGGQRKMVVDFNCYGCSHEQAYNYAALWQSSLELETVQARLRKAGIAVWLNGSVQDLSALLNSGFEGRALLEVAFGVAANLTEDLGAIQTINVSGDVTTDQDITETINAQVIAP